MQWTKYYPGKVDKRNRDGTLDLKFDDGDFKTSVPPRQVRKLRGGGGGKDSKDNEDDDLEEGDRIEAKVKGWTKYYPGKVHRRNRDGTYDLRFDDGDSKSNVARSFIRRAEKKQAKRPPGPKREGGRRNLRHY